MEYSQDFTTPLNDKAMFLPSHIASGYILGNILHRREVFPWTAAPFLPVLLIASILPDVDGIWSNTVAGHHSILHTPIFWIIIFAGMTGLGMISNFRWMKPVSFGIFLGALLHLMTDWITARTVGIQWLYPFSTINFDVYPVQPEKGQIPVWEMVRNPYFSFYFENKILLWFEIGMNAIALILFGKNKLRGAPA